MIHVISQISPLKVLMTKLGTLNGRLTNWGLLLSPYGMHFKPQKETKGQAIADFLAEHPISENSKLQGDILDEVEMNMFSKEQMWQLFYDGAVRRDAARVGVMLVSPHKHVAY